MCCGVGKNIFVSRLIVSILKISFFFIFCNKSILNCFQCYNSSDECFFTVKRFSFQVFFAKIISVYFFCALRESWAMFVGIMNEKHFRYLNDY